jgi:hypothetical protein
VTHCFGVHQRQVAVVALHEPLDVGERGLREKRERRPTVGAHGHPEIQCGPLLGKNDELLLS